jgi:hypothetical protein
VVGGAGVEGSGGVGCCADLGVEKPACCDRMGLLLIEGSSVTGLA